MKYNDWNEINPFLIQQNDTAEIARLYNYTREFMLHFFDNNEDSVQDWLIRVLKYIHTYDPEYKFSNWLYTLASNQKKYEAKLTYRQSRRIAEYDISEATEKIQLHHLDMFDIDEAFTAEQKQILEDRIDQLNNPDRDFFEGYLIGTIDKANGSNRKKFHRLKNKLKD